ncbi:unnamed protein product, partial [Colletotrichum noveboracense]
RTFPDRVAGHVLTRLQMHNFNFVERRQVNLPARSVRHLESIMELVFVEEVARKMAVMMREAWVDSEGPSWWWVSRHKTVAEWLRASLAADTGTGLIVKFHLKGILEALESDGTTSELSGWSDLTAGSGLLDASLA